MGLAPGHAPISVSFSMISLDDPQPVGFDESRTNVYGGQAGDMGLYSEIGLTLKNFLMCS